MGCMAVPPVLLWLAIAAASAGGGHAATFDVASDFVGTNVSQLAQVRWDLYNGVRACGLHIFPDGSVQCNTSSTPVCAAALAQARKRRRNIVTLGVHGLSPWECFNNTSRRPFCDTVVRNVGPAVRSCGPGIKGLNFDYEGTPTPLGRAGIVSRAEARYFTQLIDGLQKSMGEGYTVGADVGSWGFSEGAYPLGADSWVDKEIMDANENLYINIMGYHADADCGISPWRKDGLVAHELWGLAKAQVNIGLGLFFFNVSADYTVVGEPTWGSLARRCPEISASECVCDGIPIVGLEQAQAIGRFVRDEGFRGVFPWASNYDVLGSGDRSLISRIGKGLGLATGGV